MKKYGEELKVSEARMPLADFLKVYNKNLPSSFPKSSAVLLKKFKSSHPAFFKHGNLWSLDEHRKKLIDWIPQNSGLLKHPAER